MKKKRFVFFLRVICFFIGHDEEFLGRDWFMCKRCGIGIGPGGDNPFTLRNIRWEITYWIDHRKMIIERCPDCHKITKIIGHRIHPEKHYDCIPF